MSPSCVPSETFHNDLPTYEEAVIPDPDLPTRTRLVPNMQNVLHHIDYSSDIHYYIYIQVNTFRDFIPNQTSEKSE